MERQRPRVAPRRNARRDMPESDFEPEGRSKASLLVVAVVGVGDSEGGRHVV